MAKRIEAGPEKLPPAPRPHPASRRPHPAQAARPAAGAQRVRARPGFAACLRDGLFGDLAAACRAGGYTDSGGKLHSAVIVLISEVHRDGADRGWTPDRFFSALGGALLAVGGRAGERTLRKFAALLFEARVFTPRRAHGRRGAITRIHLDVDRLVDGGARIAARGAARRASAAARMRAYRRECWQKSANSRAIAGPLLPTELDQIDTELARIDDSRASASRVPGAAFRVRPIKYADDVPSRPAASPPPKSEKQIPQTPTPLARGPVDGGPKDKEGKEAGRLTFASAEALEDHLYRFVSGRPLVEAERLGSEVGPGVLAALRRAHPQGIQGLKSSLAEDARRACRQVARAVTPRVQTPRARALRDRQRLDRQAAAATVGEVRDAAVAILGPGAAANLNPSALARQGLSLPSVELAFGRIQRNLRIGSDGPRALRNPLALPAYTFVAFRRDAACARPRGAP